MGYIKSFTGSIRSPLTGQELYRILWKGYQAYIMSLSSVYKYDTRSFERAIRPT